MLTLFSRLQSRPRANQQGCAGSEDVGGSGAPDAPPMEQRCAFCGESADGSYAVALQDGRRVCTLCFSLRSERLGPLRIADPPPNRRSARR